VLETSERWSDIVFLSHLEVLSEVLVSAPPVGPNHAQSLVSSSLMEVRVSNVVLLSISRESSVSVRAILGLVNFSKSESPVFHHSFLLYIGFSFNI
jgi:hypothetical protein